MTDEMTLNAAAVGRKQRFSDRWSAKDLVVIGIFAAAAKISTVLIAMVGGGMNPVSLLLKNMVFTTLLVVMLFKVKQSGTLTLFVIVSTLVNFLLLGGNITLIVPMLFAALLSELLMASVRKAGLPGSVYWGVGCFDLICKFGSLGISYLMMRESPALMAVVIPIVIIGYVGSLIGLWTGYRSTKELRHAGIICF
ncbi:MptD family putative ECF transporter S component [Parasutterella muris]|uniref:MptD family putative ECF transporter S component n=2 Tax=Parasutterella TaxID=577310 RepID=UPI00203E60DE|nr:MptD family putative ECF transporter S component [Parasutterella muris]